MHDRPTPKPETFIGDLHNLPAALRPLQEVPHWVLWQWELRADGRWTKPPIKVDGRYASTSNPGTWVSFEEALAAFGHPDVGADGIGFVLTEEDGLSGADLDGVRDPDTGAVEIWAREIVELLEETYCEISPSGTGLRLFWKGKVDRVVKNDAASVEIYGKGRYLTITGLRVAGCPNEIRAAPLTEGALRARADKTKPRKEDELPDHLKDYIPDSSGTGLGFSPEPPSPWKALNAEALANPESWIFDLFGSGVKRQSGGEYRISSKSLGRPLQEDLVIYQNSIKDFGVADQGDEKNGWRSPLDLVMEWSEPQKSLGEAADWLRARLHGPGQQGGGGGGTPLPGGGGTTGGGPGAGQNRQTGGGTAADDGLDVVRVSDVESKDINWFWDQRVALGKLTLLVGLPDVNKSTMALDLAARGTTARAMPDGEVKLTRGNVIILSAEDDIADTIRPRLEAAGADLDRVYVIRATKLPKGAKRTFDLTQDIERLERMIEEIGDVVMVIIDPYSAYMGKAGKIDSYRSTDVRGVLTPLCEMVGRYEVAVIGIGHLNKSGSTTALLRVLDSVAFVAASRGVYLVVRDVEDDEKRMLLPAKNNIGRIRTGLAFKIILKEVPKLRGRQPAIEWQEGAIDTTADEALAAKPEDGRKSEDAERAKKIIIEMMVGGPRPAKEIEDRMTKEGIGKKSLWTAKKGISVRSEKVGTVWWWALPGQEIEGM